MNFKLNMAAAVAVIAVIALFTLTTCGSSAPTSQTARSSGSTASAVPLWTGDGGRGRSIAILELGSSGLAEDQGYLPNLVQGELVSNFSGFSAMSVLDRITLEAQYAELLSGYYSDDAEASWDLGHLPNTDYLMLGNITRTGSGFALQLRVTRTADKMTEATYSQIFSFAELDTLVGIRRASLDLLEKLGVKPTATAREELTSSATRNHIGAQTALSQGIVAQRQGAEVAALTQFMQAAALNPSIPEAASRSTILATTISSGNIGEAARNDIEWRRAWIARLTETEQFFNDYFRNVTLNSVLYYVNSEIQQTSISYERETVDIRGGLYFVLRPLSDNWVPSASEALQTVYDGLRATGRASAWGLDRWPQRPITDNGLFPGRVNFERFQYSIPARTLVPSSLFNIDYEMLNSRNEVIAQGRATLSNRRVHLCFRDNRFSFFVDYVESRRNINVGAAAYSSFQRVKVDDITENLIVRITEINEQSVKDVLQNNGIIDFGSRTLQLQNLSKERLEALRGGSRNFDIFQGRLIGIDRSTMVREGEGRLTIPNSIWGEQVTSIGFGEFNLGFDLRQVTIGSNIMVERDSFPPNFAEFYEKNRRRAGTYTLTITNDDSFNHVYIWSFRP